MKLTEIALRESRLTWSVAACMALAGAVAFNALPRAEDPGIVFRFAVLEASFPGASAGRVEAVVTRKLDDALKGVPELEFVRSQSFKGRLFTVIKAKERYPEVEVIWDKVRRRLAAVRAQMPAEVRGPFMDEGFSEVYSIVLTVSGNEGVAPAELESAARGLRERLLRLEDVSRAELIGERQEQVVVAYDDLEMSDSAVTPTLLRAYLQAQNPAAPGGLVRSGEGAETRRQLVEPAGVLDSLRALERTPVLEPEEDDPTPLEELVEVSRGYVDPAASYLTSSGRPAVGVAVSMRDGGNIQRLGAEVERVLGEVRERALERPGVDSGADAGAGGSVLTFDRVAFEPERVAFRINRLFRNLLYSLGVVFLILVLALGLREGSVVAVAMPVTVLTSLAVMYAIGLDMNLVSIAAFIVVLGMMVDNHIVISERILCLRERGVPAREAAVQAAGELHGPLLTAALTTIAGFLPIYLVTSPAGDYVSPLFSVVAITFLCSEFYGFTLTPLLSVYFFKVTDKSHQPVYDGPGYRRYRRILGALLARPALVLPAALVLFGAAAAGGRLLPKIFFPPSDRPIFTLDLEFPGGTAIERTREAAAELDAFVAGTCLAPDGGGGGGVTNWATFVGRNAPRFVLNHLPRQHSPEFAYVLFNTTFNRDFPALRDRLEEFCRGRFPGAQVRVRRLESGPAVGWPVKVRVVGEDKAAVFAVVDELAAHLRTFEALSNVNHNWGDPEVKFAVVPDRDEAARRGATSADIALAVQTVLTGLPATELREPGGDIPVILKASLEEEGLEAVKAVHVYPRPGQGKKPVPLGEIAAVSEVLERPTTIRRDGRYSVTVRADVRAGVNPKEIDAALGPWLESRRPGWAARGVEAGLRGEGYEAAQANLAILKKVPWAGVLIVLLLLRQTRSFRRTAIVISAVPMGVIGVVAGLLLLRQPLGFMTLVGVVALTGIVVNNAIILLERVRQNLVEQSLDPRESIVEAALNRLRPILLTTVTTIGGIAPLYLRDNPMWHPMATALIFGLVGSTALVLLVVPVLYAALFRVRFEEGAVGEAGAQPGPG